MKVLIQFDADNAAFEDDWDGQIAALLLRAQTLLQGSSIEQGSYHKSGLRDFNGNTVGFVMIEKS